jgi:hypothetical protein
VKKDSPLELYRISDDPNEQHNLAGDYPQLVNQLDSVMRKMHKPSVNYPIAEDKK